MKIFFVSGQGSVTTLSQPQTLYVYQFVNYEPGNLHNTEQIMKFNYNYSIYSTVTVPVRQNKDASLWTAPFFDP